MLKKFFPLENKSINETRFNQKKESKSILEYIDQLKNKEDELKKTSDKLGQATIDYAKYLVLRDLIKALKDKIEVYNIKPSLPEAKENSEYVDLLQEMRECIEKTKANHFALLNTPRNNNLKTGQKMLTCGALGAVGTAFTFGTFGTGLGVMALAACSTQALGSTYMFTGTTATAQLIVDFLETVKSTIKNFNFILHIQSENIPKIIYNDDNMICPITQSLIENPVICELDGCSYEKEALMKWLTQHRKSYKTGKLMDPDVTVESVITDNHILKKKIDNFKVYSLQKEEVSTPSLG